MSSSLKLVSIPAVSKLSSRVIRILGLNPSLKTLQGTNTYLIGSGSERFLIDTGEGTPGYISNLVDVMKQEGVQSLNGILITHWYNLNMISSLSFSLSVSRLTH